jgi:hypothetical protein
MAHLFGQKDAEVSTDNIWVAAGDGDVDRVRALLDAGGNPNDQDENGLTPLSSAASYGRKEVLELLIARGADPTWSDEDGDTALHACCDLEVRAAHSYPLCVRLRSPINPSHILRRRNTV